METVVAKRILNLKEIANFMGVHERKIYRLIKEGTLPTFRLGGTWHFDLESIEQWMSQHTINRCTKSRY